MKSCIYFIFSVFWLYSASVTAKTDIDLETKANEPIGQLAQSIEKLSENTDLNQDVKHGENVIKPREVSLKTNKSDTTQSSKNINKIEKKTEIKNQSVEEPEHEDTLAVPTADKSAELDNLVQKNNPRNEIVKFFMLPWLADKTLSEKDLDGDIMWFLKAVYPTVEEAKLEPLSDVLKWTVVQKRKYDAFVDKLRHEVMAERLYQKDAPIVAKDGEFASLDDELRKKTPEGKYQVSYTPYPYLEYDKGELGEPVRRRDKNYVEFVFPEKEILLAVMEFDFKRVYQIWKNMPKLVDPSAEKVMTLQSGAKIRILLETSKPGNKKDINGVFEVLLPKDMYMNGDYLNRHFKPKFFLKEHEAQNISDMQIFSPLAQAVLHDGNIQRLYVGHYFIPFTIKREDVQKKTIISGQLGMQLCRKDGDCFAEIAQHRLELKASETYEASIYENTVTQSHLELPEKHTKLVGVKQITYDKKHQILEVLLEKKVDYQQIVVMAEDENGTNFVHPTYRVDGDNIKVTFEVRGKDEAKVLRKDMVKEPNVGSEIAVSVVLDQQKTYRDVAAVGKNLVINEGDHVSAMTFLSYFLWGILIMFLPMINYLWGRTALLWREKGYAVFRNYIYGLGMSLLIWRFWGRSFGDVGIYENYLLWMFALALGVALLAECFEFMDFSLFRPWRKCFSYGFYYGLGVGVLLMLLPMYHKQELEDIIYNGAWIKSLMILLAILWGNAVALIILRLVQSSKLYWWFMFKRFSGYYCGCGLLWIFWLIYATKGWSGVFVSLGCACLWGGLWYIYPMAVETTLAMVKKGKKDVFYKIQNHCAWAVSGIAILFFIGIMHCENKVYDGALSYEEAIGSIQERVKNGKDTLVLLENNYDVKTIYNRLEGVWHLGQQAKILFVNAKDKNMESWLTHLKLQKKDLSTIMFYSRI